MAALYEPAHEEVQALVEQFASVGQEHLFTFWDELSSEEKASLWQQLKTFDIQRIAVSPLHLHFSGSTPPCQGPTVSVVRLPRVAL